MIVPMHKYTFLVYHAGYKDFLKDIRKVGVVHINEKIKEPTPEMQEHFRHLSEVDRTIKKLEWLTPEETKEKPDIKTGEAVFQRVKDIEKEIEHIHHQVVHAEKEQKQLKPWGDFDWEMISRLEEKGLKIRFMYCNIKKYDPVWEQENYLHIVNDLDGYRYFLKLEKEGCPSCNTEDIAGADELILPGRSLSRIYDEIRNLNRQTEALNHELHQIAWHSKPMLKEYFLKVQQSLADQNAILQTTQEVDGKVQILEGWVPETKKAELDEYLVSNNILFLAEKPGDEERVPILLKNNRFAKLYEVIGKLYDLPNHRELDLVPFFAPFYMMFFGFSLGDAGYGLFIVLIATIFKRKKPELKAILSLAQFLGLSTVIFGILTGTFFGINLIEAEIGWLEQFKKFMISTDQLFNLAIIFGVIQILFGMVLKVVNITKGAWLLVFFVLHWLACFTDRTGCSLRSKRLLIWYQHRQQRLQMYAVWRLQVC
jgi:V/A-type H+/Na+-transporting ATPase subunit I